MCFVWMQGSTKTTRYSWDFGDGSPLVNQTGLSRAKKVSHAYVKNGHYVVTVTAVNNAGLASVSTAVTVLGRLLFTFFFR